MAQKKQQRKRQPRAQTRRAASAANNESGKANRAVRGRLVSLESRLVLIERMLGLPTDMDIQDAILALRHQEPGYVYQPKDVVNQSILDPEEE